MSQQSNIGIAQTLLEGIDGGRDPVEIGPTVEIGCGS
jgi:hypothetical protein